MDKIFLASPHMSDEGYEQKYVQEAFDTNWIAPLGPNVDAFENELAEMVGIEHATALSSGTAAIHLALKAVGCSMSTISASSSSKPFTLGPSGAIQLVSKASCTYCCSYPSALIWGDAK